MTKTELVAAISDKTGVAKTDVEKVLKGFEDEVHEVVSAGKEKLTLPGFLSFERTRRAARTGRNPQTGETIQVPAANAVKVTAGSKLKATAKASR
jgi:DNA-binding protein HU-beta